MSASVQVDIFCDIKGDSCLHWVYGGPTSKKARIREARAYAKMDGWAFVYDDKTNSWNDVCPNCLAKEHNAKNKEAVEGNNTLSS